MCPCALLSQLLSAPDLPPLETGVNLEKDHVVSTFSFDILDEHGPRVRRRRRHDMTDVRPATLTPTP